MNILNKKNKNQADNYLPGGKQDHNHKNSSLFFKFFNGFFSSKNEKQKSFKQEKKELEDYGNVINREKNNKKSTSAQFTSQVFANNISTNKKQSSQSSTSSSLKKSKAKQLTKIKASSKAQVVGERWRAPKILKTNLIKNEITTFIDWKKNLISLAVSLAISSSIIALAFSGLLFWENNANKQGATLDSELIDINQKIIETEEKAITIDAFQKKLMITKELLDKHRYWTNFFSFLEDNLLKEVYIIGDLSLDFGSKFTFDCQADSFSTIADQIRVLKNNSQVLDVVIDGGKVSMSTDEDGRVQNLINFSMDINVDPNIFYK